MWEGVNTVIELVLYCIVKNIGELSTLHSMSTKIKIASRYSGRLVINRQVFCYQISCAMQCIISNEDKYYMFIYISVACPARCHKVI